LLKLLKVYQKSILVSIFIHKFALPVNLTVHVFKKLRKMGHYFRVVRLFYCAFIVYFITVEPTSSFWDAGEYISTSAKLQVGHPPGAPLMQMIGAFFAMFAFGDDQLVARMVNFVSGLDDY